MHAKGNPVTLIHGNDIFLMRSTTMPSSFGRLFAHIAFLYTLTAAISATPKLTVCLITCCALRSITVRKYPPGITKVRQIRCPAFR